MKKYIYSLITLYCIISPFYFLSSGYPQIADFILIIAFLLFIFSYRIIVNKVTVLLIVILFLITIINLVYSIIFSSTDFFISSIYYYFNFMLVLMVLSIYFKDGLEILKKIYKGISISLIVQVLVSLIFLNITVSRQTLFFNNPNQLGYYALLSFSILTLIFYLIKSNIVIYIVTSMSAVYLAVLSNSTSTIIAILLLLCTQVIVMFIFVLNSKQKISLLLLFFVLFSSIVFFWDEIKSFYLIENALNRIESKESTFNENFSYRGYDRLLQNPTYIILGAGEGLFVERFKRGEIHSTFIAFLFNYGIITFFLLVSIFVLLIRRFKLLPIVILILINLYGLTHNGI